VRLQAKRLELFGRWFGTGTIVAAVEVSRDRGSMVDLNTLVTPPSNLYVYYAYAIADSGEILALGALPNGDSRVVVLTPAGDCDDDCEQRISESQNHPAAQRANPAAPMIGKPAGLLRNPFGDRFPSFGRAVVSSN
jgi:hypothetical protein